MNELVKHLVKNNIDSIVECSILNCHAIGVHSVMLLESPGQTIRLYVAVGGHELWKNLPEHYMDGMSIGFHPHHCNLTLHCIRGAIWNWQATVEPRNGNTSRAKLRGYIYRSQITEGKQGFELTIADAMLTYSFPDKIENDSIFMSADELHTVGVDRYESAAWLVYEGKEDPNYRPVCYSTSHLESIVSDERMYQKPTKGEVIDLLKFAKLL